MSEMFDSAGGNIPAGAQIILLPSDGVYSKNNAAVKARFPNATYQTYTAVGQVAAEWIDVETGCVWPPSAAVSLWDRWKGNGITRGFYCATSVKPQIQALLMLPSDSPEWFEADPTQNPHVRAGDAQTQWGFFGSYDETEIAPQPTPIGGIPKMGLYILAPTQAGDPTVGIADGVVVRQVSDVAGWKAAGAVTLPADHQTITDAIAHIPSPGANT